jgi:hypothetical protein
LNEATVITAPAGEEVDEEAAARARFQVFDSTIVLLRPHLLAHTPIPEFVDRIVSEMHGVVRLAAGDERGRR